MLDFIINYWMIFAIIAIVLLLGLFGYIMDRRKYEEYKEEILNEQKSGNTLNAEPSVSAVANALPVQNNVK